MQRKLRLIENAFSWRLSRFHNWYPSERVDYGITVGLKKKMLCKGITGMRSLNWEPEQQLWRDLAQVKPPVAFGSDIYLLLGHRHTDFLPDSLQNIKGRGMPNIFTCLNFHQWWNIWEFEPRDVFKQTESTLLQLESLSTDCFIDFQPVAELFLGFFPPPQVPLLKLFCITQSMWWDPEAISSWKHYQQAAMLSIMTIPFKGFWNVFKWFLNRSPSLERQITSSNMDLRKLEAFFFKCSSM